MKKVLFKIISLMLIFALAVSIASCGFHSNKKVRKILEDDPWFDANIMEIETGVDEGRNTGWLYQDFIGSDDSYYIIESRGDYDYPPDDEIDWDSIGIE